MIALLCLEVIFDFGFIDFETVKTLIDTFSNIL